MRSITLRLTTTLVAVVVAGLVLVHGQTPVQAPWVQTPPAQQAPAPQPPAPQMPTMMPTMQSVPPAAPTPQTIPPAPGTVTADAPLVPPLPLCPELPAGINDVGPMLDHIESLVNETIGKESASVAVARPTMGASDAAASATGATGTAGGSQPAPMTATGKTKTMVAIDRDKLDEIRAAADQINAILKK